MLTKTFNLMNFLLIKKFCKMNAVVLLSLIIIRIKKVTPPPKLKFLKCILLFS